MNQYECYNCVVVCVVLVTFCSTSSSTREIKVFVTKLVFVGYK